MYIKNNTENGILSYFPYDTRKYLSKINIGSAYEIHIAPDAPICVYFPDGRYFINKGGERTHNLRNAAIISRDEFNKCIELVTGASVYAIKDEIAGGYVTIRGGHRVGICGSAVIRNGEVTFLKNISALNFRLARECIGVSDVIMPYIMKDEVRSTLVISPPGGGKTTMLRDIARNLSLAGKRVSIVDERCELAAMYEGKSSFDLGVSCDVLSGIEKSEGMLMMLRSMSPEVIITDELGGDRDEEAVLKLLNCGAAVIASVHGRGIHGERYKGLIKYFDIAVTLSKRGGAGTVERIDIL